MDDVLSFFSDSTLYDRPATQPVITTVQAAQQTFPKQRSDATVIVFTDSPSSDATPWSHRFTDQNAEQNVLQISLLWKSRYFLSLPAGTDYASDGVDVYRRLSLTNHGDTFFLHGASDLANSLLMVMGSQYYSGSVTLGYKTSDNIDLTMSVDNPGDTVYFLLTIDPVTKSAMPTITRATLHADGTFYRLVLSIQYFFMAFFALLNVLVICKHWKNPNSSLNQHQKCAMWQLIASVVVKIIYIPVAFHSFQRFSMYYPNHVNPMVLLCRILDIITVSIIVPIVYILCNLKKFEDSNFSTFSKRLCCSSSQTRHLSSN